MTKRQKKNLTRIIAAIVLFVAALLIHHFVELPWYGVLAVFLVPYLLVGYDVLWKAVRNIAHGQVFDENFLMGIATVGALIIQEYPEAVFVMLFYQVGEFFQGWAVGKSRKSIAALMDIRPEYANVERDGELEEVDPDEVAVGETIVIKPGERVPLDGVVLDGVSTLNTAALTGESLPRDIAPGDDVISGCVNLTGVLRSRPPRSTTTPPWPRSWTWWRTPPPRSPRASSSSPASPGGTPPPWSSGRWPWPSSPPSSPGSGPSGWSRPSSSWSSPAPAPWSSRCPSPSSAASAAPLRPACW